MKRCVATVFLIVVISISLNAYIEDYIVNIHSPEVYALAPSVVSIETSTISFLENPALSVYTPNASIYAGVLRRISNYEFLTANFTSFKTVINKIVAFSIATYDMDFYQTTHGIIGNIAVKTPINLLFGVNISSLMTDYEPSFLLIDGSDDVIVTDTTVYKQYNMDLGMHYKYEWENSGTQNRLMAGASLINIINVYDVYSTGFNFGAAYEVEDKANIMPAIEKITIIYEKTYRTFSGLSMFSQITNSSSVGVALKIFKIFNLNAGISEKLYTINYSVRPVYMDYSVNYGVTLEIPLFMIINKYNTVLKISCSDASVISEIRYEPGYAASGEINFEF